MMFCTKRGAKNSDDAKFCGSSGVKLEKISAESENASGDEKVEKISAETGNVANNSFPETTIDSVNRFV